MCRLSGKGDVLGQLTADPVRYDIHNYSSQPYEVISGSRSRCLGDIEKIK